MMDYQTLHKYGSDIIAISALIIKAYSRKEIDFRVIMDNFIKVKLEALPRKTYNEIKK